MSPKCIPPSPASPVLPCPGRYVQHRCSYISYISIFSFLFSNLFQTMFALDMQHSLFNFSSLASDVVSFRCFPFDRSIPCYSLYKYSPFSFFGYWGQWRTRRISFYIFLCFLNRLDLYLLQPSSCIESENPYYPVP